MANKRKTFTKFLLTLHKRKQLMVAYGNQLVMPGATL